MTPTTDITLHGTWIKHESSEPGDFLIWGEQRFPEVLAKPRGRRPKILRHPYASSPEDVREILRALSEALMLDAVTIARAIHVLSIVHWIGGVSVVTTIVLPNAMRLEAPQALAAFESFERRFARQARISNTRYGETRSPGRRQTAIVRLPD